MKVLQINSVCGQGSTGRIATDLSDILDQEGHECRIAYGRGSVPEKYQKIAVRIGTDWDVRWHGLATRLIDAHGFGSLRATEAFIDWVRDYDPDVIHLHNIHGYYINVEVLFDYLKEAKKPVVWTLHDCWAFTGHCSHYTFVGCDQWKKSACSRGCAQKKAYPACWGLSRAAENFERKRRAFTGVERLTLVTPSQWLADEVQCSFLKDYPVQVIRNGIDLNVFKPTASDFRERHGLQGKRIILGVANVWDARKGLDDFVALSGMLDENSVIVLVGLTGKQISSLPRHILGIERTQNVQELAAVYTAADVFVNPTHEDNFPTTNLEALACGTPVVTYDTGGSPEAGNEETSIVVEPRVPELKAALLSIKKETEKCVKRGRAFGRENFLKYLDLYL